MWSIEEAKRLKSQHEHGWTVGESAEILERSELDIRNKLLSMGLKPIEDGEKPAKLRKCYTTVSEDIRNKIINLRSQGYEYKYISERTNVSRATISRVLKEAGKTNPNHKTHGDNGLADKCAEFEKVVNNQSAIIKGKNDEIINANLEIQMLKNKIKVLEAERAEKAIEPAEKATEPADNWSVRELKNVLGLLEPLAIDNGADAMTIGQAIGRLKMMISIAQEEERRHGF